MDNPNVPKIPEPAAIHQLFKDYHVVRKLGTGGNGAAYAVVKKSDYAKARQSTRPSKMDMSKLLRVAKVKLQSTPQDCARWEIDAMRNRGIKSIWPMKHRRHNIFSLPQAVSHLKSFVESGFFFTTTYDGVSLEKMLEFAAEQRLVFPLGFVWHIACRLVRTLAYMHHGVSDAETWRDPDWVGPETVCHLDIFEGNVTLQRAGRGVVPIIIDWGRCVVSGRRRSDGGRGYLGAQDRRQDCQDVAQLLHMLLHGPPGGPCLLLGEGTGRCDCESSLLSRPCIRDDPLREQAKRFLDRFVRRLALGPGRAGGINAIGALNKLAQPQQLFGDGASRVRKTSSLPRQFKAAYDKCLVSDQEALTAAEAGYLGRQVRQTRAVRQKRGREGEDLEEGLPAKRLRGRDPMI